MLHLTQSTRAVSSFDVSFVIHININLPTGQEAYLFVIMPFGKIISRGMQFKGFQIYEVLYISVS